MQALTPFGLKFIQREINSGPFILWFGFCKLSGRDPSHGSIHTDLGFVFPEEKTSPCKSPS